MLESKILKNEQETLNLASRLAARLKPGCVLFLKGDLGSGKTTFVRGILRGFNFLDPVKSPTYTLVEEYEFPWGKLHHFDLYRIDQPQELEHMGIQEYFTPDSINIIEWPERGLDYIPSCDLQISLSFYEDGRKLDFKSNTQKGDCLIKEII